MVIKTNIIQVDKNFEIQFIKDCFIEIVDSKIYNILTESKSNDYIDYSKYICIPGLIDTHIHLSQYHVRGKHSDNLLDWLNDYIFAEEYKSRNKDYALDTARQFYQSLIKSGTTTSVVYTSIFEEACDSAFEVAEEMGVRSIIGKINMDCNCPDFLKEDTNISFETSVKLFEKWNQKNSRLEYIFTPRFAPVCSSKLMKNIGDFIHANDAYLQTHLSENKNEIEWVKSLFPDCKTYTEVYKKHNILSSKTIMGHAIHLEDSEIEMMLDTGTKISHCPDSNFFLKSGAFHFNRIKNSGLDFGLATDVGAGTSFSMFHVMKMCNYRQEEYIVKPEEAFYYATLGAAKAISKEDIIGSIEVNKAADLVFIDVDEWQTKTAQEIMSDLVYMGSEMKIVDTFVDGRKI